MRPKTALNSDDCPSFPVQTSVSRMLFSGGKKNKKNPSLIYSSRRVFLLLKDLINANFLNLPEELPESRIKKKKKKVSLAAIQLAFAAGCTTTTRRRRPSRSVSRAAVILKITGSESIRRQFSLNKPRGTKRKKKRENGTCGCLWGFKKNKKN